MAASSSLAWSTAALLRMAGVAGAAFAGGTIVGGGRGRSEAATSDSDSNANASRVTNDDLILKHGVPAPMGPTGPLCYENHCLQYDPQRKVPLWVAEHLTRDKAHPDTPGADRRRSKFKPDARLDPLGRADNSDFHASGWSRGHMAPAGNNKHSQKAMDDTFLLSNVVPQVPT